MNKTRCKEKVTYPTIISLFCVGSILGFIIEGIWYYIKIGRLESHSALVWGSFCIVYGFGAVAVYIASIFLSGKKLPIQFLVFAVAGGAVEYFTGLIQELVFGSTSWDYSHHPFNIGGRVSLQMAALWGLLGVLFVRLLYPLLKRLFDKLHGKVFFVICILVGIFMIVNMLVSACAVLRWSERLDEEPASNQIEEFLDRYYDNETMEKIYPNMNFGK